MWTSGENVGFGSRRTEVQIVLLALINHVSGWLTLSSSFIKCRYYPPVFLRISNRSCFKTDHSLKWQIKTEALSFLNKGLTKINYSISSRTLYDFEWYSEHCKWLGRRAFNVIQNKDLYIVKPECPYTCMQFTKELL